MRAQDGDYKALLQVAERFELPKETAGKIYDMKQDAEQQKQKIDANANLSDEQRNKALAAIARETEIAVRATMGNKVFKAYQQNSGQWMQNLGVSAAPPEPEPVQPLAPQPSFPLVFPGVVPPAPPK